MTPAEQKAIELVEKFKKVGCSSFPEAEHNSAKQCALVHLMGIREYLERNQDYQIHAIMSYQADMQFFDDVKTAIEKL